jgi:hypothetical protein
METEWKSQEMKNAQKFYCEVCDYKTSRRNDFLRHQASDKHKHAHNAFDISAITRSDVYKCSNCEFTFKTNSGLWKHNKTCKNRDAETKEEKDKLIKYLIEENKEFKQMIMQLATKPEMNNCNNNVNINSNNKTFNLQVFLNETCRDAMNLSDFMRSIQFQLTDLEKIGEDGYIEGFSDVIIRGLTALGVEKRPIHCSDTKREVLYVKENDKWEKENEDMFHLKQLIDYVQIENIKNITKWRDLYPTCVLSNSAYTDRFNNICHEVTGGDCKKISLSAKTNKIISRIAKEVCINKNM